MANLSQRTGTTPVNTRIGLANNQASSVQNFNGYDSQELIGHVFIDGTTDYRAAVKVTVVKNGAGVYEVAATDIAGDDISGSPIVTFSMSGSILQATLPNITGFSSAYIDYHLVSPKLNATYPLSVDAGQVVSGTLDSSVLPEAASSAIGAVKKNRFVTKRYASKISSDTSSGSSTLPLTNLPQGVYKIKMYADYFYSSASTGKAVMVLYVNGNILQSLGINDNTTISSQAYLPGMSSELIFEAPNTTNTLVINYEVTSGLVARPAYILEKIENYEEITTEWD